LKVVRNGQQILIEQPPAGTYTFRYSFSSGKGNWAANHAWRVGMALNAPLIPVTSLNELARKALPPQQSFLSVNGDNLVVSAIKKADRGDGVIVRLFDMRGDSAATPLTFLGRNRNFSETNMLEEDLKRGNQSTLHLRPYEIDTVRLDVAAAANPKAAH
jgi:alpha-mannosidase